MWSPCRPVLAMTTRAPRGAWSWPQDRSTKLPIQCLNSSGSLPSLRPAPCARCPRSETSDELLERPPKTASRWWALSLFRFPPLARAPGGGSPRSSLCGVPPQSAAAQVVLEHSRTRMSRNIRGPNSGRWVGLLENGFGAGSAPRHAIHQASQFGSHSYRWKAFLNRYGILQRSRRNSLLRWLRGIGSRENGERNDGLEQTGTALDG